MNLERVSNEEKLNLCRKYYLGGFAFLPFLWLVNIFWFFREAFLVPAYTEQSQIKGLPRAAQAPLLQLSLNLELHLPGSAPASRWFVSGTRTEEGGT
uniref:Gamma-secretase subunit PEN-2 n=1 Tax=Sus scrofa TaxID=9823 RepID=A0A8D1ZNB0_PIG